MEARLSQSLLHAYACDPQSVDLDQKMTARRVARRFDVSVRTIDRWLEKPHLAFPKPVMFTHDISGRVANRYWKLGDLVAWEIAQGAKGAASHQP
jgi:hypothetical protein